MTRDSLAFAISGVLFGLMVGWIIGSQQAGAPAPAPVAAASAAPPPSSANAPAESGPPPAPLDQARVSQLEQQAKAQPSNAQVRVDLANAYFDAHQYADAVPWYQAALKLTPRDVNVSTDLGVAYYSLNQIDRALSQFDYSLSIDPRHLKTLLNKGIVLAFGKSDLDGAAAMWRQVVQIAPTSEEGRRAQQGLDGIQSAHAANAP
jgi:tetratricopeptide (TPR) repeat protein